MALNQINRQGQIYIEGSAADIEAARSGAVLVRGRLYWETTVGLRVGRATANDNIVWERSQADINAAVAIETARATAAEGAIAANLAQEILDRTAAVLAERTRAEGVEANLSQAIAAEEAARILGDDTEITARIAGDLVNANALAAEIARATAAEDAEVVARIAGDAAVQTALTNAMNAAVAALRDTTVADIIPVTYTEDQTLSLNAVLGANRPDGIYALPFSSSNVTFGATIDNGVASGQVGHEMLDISFGDILRVKINGGAIESVTLVDDLDRQKFLALDSAISALQAATTQTAIRSHFSATGWTTFTNGVFDTTPSAAPNNDLATSLLDGKAFLDVDQTFSEAGPGSQTINKHLVDLWGEVSSINTNGAFGAESGTRKEGNAIRLGGSPLLENAVFTGAFAMDMAAVNVVNLPYATFKTFTKTVDVNGGVSRGAATVPTIEFWFDQDGDPQFTYVPN